MFKRMLRSLALALLATTAGAQIRLPVAPLLSQPLGTLDRQANELASRTLIDLSQARQREIDLLIREHRQRIDTDRHGNPIVRNEVLALSPSDAALTRAQSLGFTIAREESIESLQMRIVVLGAPAGVATPKALMMLKEGDRAGRYDFNHIFLRSAAQMSAVAGAGIAPSTKSVATGPASPHSSIRIGLLDTGVNVHHPALDSARIVQWGCKGEPVAAAHGTAVASILVGRGPGFSGVQPDAELYSADVYCGQPVGGAVDSIVAALGWLVGQHIPVINVSLVGPPNLLLEHTVAALAERGFLIVAAVGNDGPAAPPLYPASYPGVVGVTAVDAREHALVEAAHGPQVMFAAPGADMAAANGEAGYNSVRGTSFASPIVAALLAGRIDAADPAQVSAAIDALSRTAIHLGKAGRDLTYGFGLVGAEYRIDPAKLNPGSGKKAELPFVLPVKAAISAVKQEYDMNTKQIMASAGLATVLAASVSAHGLLGGGAGGLGGGFGGGLNGGLSSLNGRGLTGQGDFNGQGQLNGSLPSAKKLDAKNKIDNSKNALTDKTSAVKDGATQVIDNTHDQSGGVARNAQAGLGNASGDAGGALTTTAAKDSSGSSLASMGNATAMASHTPPADMTHDAKPTQSSPVMVGAPARASTPVTASKPAPATATPAKPTPSRSIGGSADQSLSAGSHSATSSGSVYAEHSKDSNSATGAASGSFN